MPVYLTVFGTLLVRSADRVKANGGVRVHRHDHPVTALSNLPKTIADGFTNIRATVPTEIEFSVGTLLLISSHVAFQAQQRECPGGPFSHLAIFGKMRAR
jgi:hypothetical protein